LGAGSIGAGWVWRGSLFQFLGFFACDVADGLTSAIARLGQEGRVAFDWTLDLLFPRTFGAVQISITPRFPLARPCWEYVGNNGDHEIGSAQLNGVNAQAGSTLTDNALERFLL